MILKRMEYREYRGAVELRNKEREEEKGDTPSSLISRRVSVDKALN